MRQFILIVSLLLLLLLNSFGCSKSSSGGGTPVESNGSMLTWDAPAYQDGTAVEGVAGYNIYYGSAPGTYSGFISTGTSTATAYSLSQLKEALPAPGTGTYYLVVTARDADGNESAYSNEISRTF